MVSSLKQQLREARSEVTEKESIVDHLKKSIKLSRHQELETEVQAYLEECTRLRELLEETMMQEQVKTDPTLTQQDQPKIDEQKIEEAFFEKECELQAMRDQNSQIHIKLSEAQTDLAKFKDRFGEMEKKMKKFNDMQNENKRKQQLISLKTKEVL